jgi:imidazolonepropionase-like amidohydrolase
LPEPRRQALAALLAASRARPESRSDQDPHSAQSSAGAHAAAWTSADGSIGISEAGAEPDSASTGSLAGDPFGPVSGGADPAAAAGSSRATTAQAAPQAASEPTPQALLCARVFTCDGLDTVHAPGLILSRGGRIEYVGPPKPVPAGYELRELEGWAVPGMVDLHSHVVSEGFGDINDMVLPINTDLSTRPTIVPSNRQMRLACAAGVTTLFLIPGSGTSSGGFGVLFKTKTRSRFEQAAIAAPGGLKIAQTHNPERRSGDLGATRSGLYWQLASMNRRALAERRHGPDPKRPLRLELQHLQKVLASEMPVLIHTAASDGVSHTVRMWRGEFPTRSVLSHGCFDGWAMRAYVAKMGMPVNQGPRTFDYFPTRSGQIVDIAARYLEAGVQDFSLNTDAPVIPAEELFLQGSVSSRFGADGRAMLRALTIHPARSFGLDSRLGSLEAGKDADLAVFSGDPLDPRSRVELVWIEGQVQYDRAADGQWF